MLRSSMRAAVGVLTLAGLGVGLVPAASAASTTVAATTTVNIRSGPGLNHSVVGKLERGQRLTATGGTDATWVRVRFDGGTAYVKHSYLDTRGKLPAAPTSIDLSTPKVTTTALNVRSGAGATHRVVSIAPEGTRLTVTGRSGHGYAQISWQGHRRWVSMQFLATVTARPTTVAPTPIVSNNKGAIALAYAKAQLGKPYKYGATGPKSFDCSGLTLRAWQAAGITLPRTSQQQIKAGTRITKSQLRPGDLVFFYGSRPTHVALYVGDGQIIHAPRPGKQVEYSRLSYMPYSGAVRPG